MLIGTRSETRTRTELVLNQLLLPLSDPGMVDVARVELAPDGSLVHCFCQLSNTSAVLCLGLEPRLSSF